MINKWNSVSELRWDLGQMYEGVKITKNGDVFVNNESDNLQGKGWIIYGNKKELINKSNRSKNPVALRKIWEGKKGNDIARVYRDADWSEYRLRFYPGGVLREEADYFTDDKDDAIGSAVSEGFVAVVKGAKKNPAGRSVKMKAGDKLYTGHVMTAAEARSYNVMTDEIEKAERMAGPNPSPMARESIEALKNSRHRLFVMIAEGAKKNPAGRLYDVYVENTKTGMTVKLNATPMTHKEAVTFKSKQTQRSYSRYFLKEVVKGAKQNPANKSAGIIYPANTIIFRADAKGNPKDYFVSFQMGDKVPKFSKDKKKARHYSQDVATDLGMSMARGFGYRIGIETFPGK